MGTGYNCWQRECQRGNRESHSTHGATRAHARALVHALVALLSTWAVARVRSHPVLHQSMMRRAGALHRGSYLHEGGLMMRTRSGCRGQYGRETKPDREQYSKHTPDHTTTHTKQYKRTYLTIARRSWSSRRQRNSPTGASMSM